MPCKEIFYVFLSLQRSDRQLAGHGHIDGTDRQFSVTQRNDADGINEQPERRQTSNLADVVDLLLANDQRDLLSLQSTRRDRHSVHSRSRTISLSHSRADPSALPIFHGKTAEIAELYHWPIDWINDGIVMVEENTLNKNKLCLTRRSGGLPFYLQSIMTDEHSAEHHRDRSRRATIENDWPFVGSPRASG